MSFTFRPASGFTERHGLFVALVGGTNSGKTYSALRLARGIAGPKGKIAVLDTEGGRTLHLKDQFAFDVAVLAPPHRPARYLEAARDAEAAGYDCLVIDSFSMEWRGVGGVLDWTDTETEAIVARKRAQAEDRGWQFNENSARMKSKSEARIIPKMQHRLMVAGFLGIRMPIIFSIRGENVFDPETNKEVFKPQCNKDFPFEVTISFRLSQANKGFIDLSDPSTYKMEGAHRDIFRDGEQLSEAHGERLAAWAKGGSVPPPAPEPQPTPALPPKVAAARDALIARFRAAATVQDVFAIIDDEKAQQQRQWLEERFPPIAAEITREADAAVRRTRPAEHEGEG